MVLTNSGSAAELPVPAGNAPGRTDVVSCREGASDAVNRRSDAILRRVFVETVELETVGGRVRSHDGDATDRRATAAIQEEDVADENKRCSRTNGDATAGVAADRRLRHRESSTGSIKQPAVWSAGRDG